MPYLEYPKSDLKRNEFLNICANTIAKDKVLNVVYVPDEITENLGVVRTDFSGLYQQVSTSLSAKEREVREKNQCMTDLKMYVRDFYEVAKRRAIRLNQPAEVLTNYGIPFSGELPKLNSEKELIDAANKIVIGDTQLVSDGYAAMTNPAASEVAEKLALATKEREDIALADRKYNIYQKDLEKLRTTVDELIREIADHLLFQLRKESESNKRRIMRTYGFEYRYLQNEPQDEVLTESPANENE